MFSAEVAHSAGWFLEHAWLIALIPAVAFALIIGFGKKLPMHGAEIGWNAPHEDVSLASAGVPLNAGALSVLGRIVCIRGAAPNASTRSARSATALGRPQFFAAFAAIKGGPLPFFGPLQQRGGVAGGPARGAVCS